jgi:predicted HicB family RNase H-like nuclease
MNTKTKEKHVSIFEDDHTRLKIMAEREGRSMRTLIKMMLDEREKGLFK